MALSFDEFRKRLLDKAKQNDEERAAITASVETAAQSSTPRANIQSSVVNAPTSLTANRYRAQKDSNITLMGKATGGESLTENRYKAQKDSAARRVEGSEIPAKLNKLKELKAQRSDEEQPRRGGVNDQYTQLYEEMKRRYGDQVDQWLEAQERGAFTPGGGFGSNEENHAADRPWYETAANAVARGAGQFDQGILSTLDFAANAIPRVEGAIFGEDPEGTLTGQLLKPLTDATGELKGWMDRGVAALDEEIAEDTKDSRAAQLATELGSGVVSALPNAVLAILSGGASTAETLAPQAEGFLSTAANAAKTVLKNPQFQISAAQTLGTSYDEAKEAGASDAAAMSAAVISTLLNSLVEVGGGIETLPGELQNADLSTGEKILEWVKSALDEGKEEVVQGVISALSNKVASGSDSPYFSTTDDSAVINPVRMAQEGAMGAAVGGILGGGQLLTNTLANRAGKAVTVDDVMPKVDGDGNPSVSASADSSLYTREPSGETAVAKAVEMAVNENGQLNIDNTKTGTYTETRSTGGAENGTELDGTSGTGVRGRSDGGTADSPLAGRVSTDGQGNLSDSGIVLLSPESQQTLTERGIVNVELHDSSADNTAFSSALDAARAADSKNGWAVTPKSPEELTQAGAKSYMDRNGSTGFAIAPDGDIEAVFANKAAGAPKGATKSTMPQAIALGGDKLDCYGSNLVDIYSRYGFEPVARVQFNAEYANPGWTADKGSPDIYFMVHNGDSADTVVQKMGNYKVWSKAELEALPVMEYDDAYAYRDAILNRRKGKAITVDDVMPKVDGEDNPSVSASADSSLYTREPSVGDMGAKTSDFPHEVKESKGKTIPDYYEKANIPEEGRADNHYTAVTEAESLHNAKLRLEQDYEGEVAELSSKTDWNNEDMDMSYMVLDDLAAEARESGDWEAFREWAKLDQERGTEAGQALQARAKRNRNSATGILAAAADILDVAGDKVDVDAVLGHVSELANRYDLANQTADVDALVQVIRDTASVRKTGFKQTKKGQKQSKYLNWALERIAGYAKSGTLTGNADTDADITAANITDADTAYRFLQDFAYTGMLNVAADQNKASVGQRVMTVRRMGLLSKTSTVMRNLVANGAFDVVDTLARDVSVPIDMLFSKITGTRSVSADAGVLSKAKRQGMLDGIAMASLETSLDVNGRDVNGKYVPNGTRTFKMSGNIVDRFFSTLEAVSGYALNVTDEMSKGGTAAEVQRGLDKLYSKGKIKATDDSLRTGGQQEALYRTFQDETVLSNVTKGIRKGLNEAHLGDVGLGDTLMPFAQVPANLADRAIDYSPAGLAKTSGKLVDALIKAKKGEFTAAKQAQVVQSLGRNITGTGLIALAAWGALKGVIRVVNPGGDDENKDKSAFEKMQGQSGTQWNLSATLRAMRGESGEWQDGDELMSIAFLEPFNANMTIGALLAEDIQLEDGVTAKTIMQDSFSGSLAALLDMPMFDTFGDIADAYTYSDKSRTGDKILDAGKTLAANEIASLIPNAAKGIAQGMDEYQRNLYTKDDTWGQLGDQFRAVFNRNSLPIKQDSFGNDMTNDGKVLNALNNNILPGWISTYDTDDLMNEISRVAKESGSDSVYPTRKAPDKLTIDSVDYPLTQDQQTQYQKTYGQTERDVRSALIENDTYSGLSADQQASAHGYAETYAKQITGNEANSQYEVSDWVEDVKDKSPEEIAEAVIQRTVESLAKKQGKNKYDGLANMLEEGSIEDKVAISLLPEEQFKKWEKYGERYDVPVEKLMDVMAYKASDESKGLKDKNGKDIEGESRQDHVKAWMNKQDLTPAQKRGIWYILYAESSYPW